MSFSPHWIFQCDMILEGIVFKPKDLNSMADFLLWDLTGHGTKASVAPLNDLMSSSFHASSRSRHVLRADRRVNTLRCSLPLSLCLCLSLAPSFLSFLSFQSNVRVLVCLSRFIQSSHPASLVLGKQVKPEAREDSSLLREGRTGTRPLCPTTEGMGDTKCDVQVDIWFHL